VAVLVGGDHHQIVAFGDHAFDDSQSLAPHLDRDFDLAIPVPSCPSIEPLRQGSAIGLLNVGEEFPSI
jgi:hypothetical protein